MTHPHGPADYPPVGYPEASTSDFSTDPPISTEKASWRMLLVFGALCAALTLVVGRFALHDKNSHALSAGSAAPTTLPTPKHDKPREHSAGGGHSASLPNTRRASGQGWTMQIPREWTAVDIPNAEEQAAWRTPGGLPGVGDVVTVVREEMTNLNLHQYVKYQRNVLAVGISTASHFRTDVSHGKGVLTYDVVANGKRARTLQLVVPTASGFASAIFAAPPETYATDLKQVRRYLETLTGR